MYRGVNAICVYVGSSECRGECRGHILRSNVFLSDSIFVSETGSLTEPGAHWLDRTNQQLPMTLLSLPLHQWDNGHVTSFVAFYISVGILISGPLHYSCFGIAPNGWYILHQDQGSKNFTLFNGLCVRLIFLQLFPIAISVFLPAHGSGGAGPSE